MHWFYILNKMNVLCTLPMSHLSTCDHNLYTFAQSTQCLYINSYFMSHLIFFLYMCICQMLQDNMKRMTLIIQMSQCVSIWVSAMILLLLYFSSVREINLHAETVYKCLRHFQNGWIIRSNCMLDTKCKWIHHNIANLICESSFFFTFIC